MSSKFNDVIHSYKDGETGTVETPSGAQVGYTISASNVFNTNWWKSDTAVGIGQQKGAVEVTFDSAVKNAAIYVTGADKTEQYIVSVDGADVDLNDWIADGRATLHTFGGYQTVDADGKLTSTGHYYHGHEAVLQFHVPITSFGMKGDGSGGGWDAVDFGFAGTDLICLVEDTPIRTPGGWSPIGDLAPGDVVETRDHGPLPVLWTTTRGCSALEQRRFARRRPIRVPKGVLGAQQDVRMTRQHRLLLRAANGDEALVPAARLVGHAGIEVDPVCRARRYVHVLLPCHAVLDAAGLPVESLYFPGAIRRLIPPDEAAAIRARYPTRAGALDLMAPARQIVETARDARRFLAPLSRGRAG